MKFVSINLDSVTKKLKSNLLSPFQLFWRVFSASILLTCNLKPYNLWGRQFISGSVWTFRHNVWFKTFNEGAFFRIFWQKILKNAPSKKKIITYVMPNGAQIFGRHKLYGFKTLNWGWAGYLILLSKSQTSPTPPSCPKS